MSKLSKTARASIGQMPTQAKKVLSDEELIRLLRIDRESKLWTGVQGIDALLRAHAALESERQKTLALCNGYLSGRVYTDLEDAVRQILQVLVTTQDNAACGTLTESDAT